MNKMSGAAHCFGMKLVFGNMASPFSANVNEFWPRSSWSSFCMFWPRYWWHYSGTRTRTRAHGVWHAQCRFGEPHSLWFISSEVCVRWEDRYLLWPNCWSCGSSLQSFFSQIPLRHNLDIPPAPCSRQETIKLSVNFNEFLCFVCHMLLTAVRWTVVRRSFAKFFNWAN